MKSSIAFVFLINRVSNATKCVSVFIVEVKISMSSFGTQSKMLLYMSTRSAFVFSEGVKKLDYIEYSASSYKGFKDGNTEYTWCVRMLFFFF